jgi:hypothetical protein
MLFQAAYFAGQGFKRQDKISNMLLVSEAPDVKTFSTVDQDYVQHY